MKKEIENQKGAQPITVIDETIIKQFQSLYYLLKGKRDTDIKLFDDYKQFSRSDIFEINQRIYRKLELHDLVTDTVFATVGLDNKEIKTFGTWHEFYSTDWDISARTKYISLEWDFNLILPNQQHDIPQTHTLRIRIGNNLKPSEMIQVVFQGSEEYELEEVQSQMVCKIDFINAQICNELKTVVADWYDALPANSKDHTLIKFILRHKVKIENLIILSTLSAGTILLNYFHGIFVESSFLNNNLFLALTFSFPYMFTVYKVGVLFQDRITNRIINRLRRDPMFEFTKGDLNKFKEINDKNQSLLKKLAFNLIIALSANGIAILIGELLQFLKSN